MRAGSTLLKALLANSPEVSHLPEVDFQTMTPKKLRKLYQQEKKKILVLKRPANFFNSLWYPKIPKIKNTKKIVLVRDAHDVVKSLQRMCLIKQPGMIGNWIGKQFALRYWHFVYNRLVNNPALQDENTIWIKYEELVAHPKEVTKKLFHFIGASKKEGIDTYAKPRHTWSWWKDDGGPVIWQKKVTVQKKPIDKFLARFILSQPKIQKLRKRLGYTDTTLQSE